MGITVFTPAPLPENEGKRSEAAVQSGLLSRVGDLRLTSIAKEARHSLRSRWCGVTVMIGETQHVVASSGGMIGMYRRATSLSSYAISVPDKTFIVMDAMIDDRFTGNPFIADGLIRFFAGAAIFDRAGYAIGVLCVTDQVPRTSFTTDDVGTLFRLADDVTKTLA